MQKLLLSTALFVSLTVAAAGAEARDRIQIVGSSTVYPFSTTVAEAFGRGGEFKTPVVESTGSGGGFKLFCAGRGEKHPDITNASRRIKKSEVARCASNNVGDITEIKIGYDGIVLANAKSAPRFSLTLRQMFLALAKEVPVGDTIMPNPYRTWRQVDPGLPDVKILVYGPPPTSGTRDAFAELALEGGCKTFPGLKALKRTNKKKYKAICHGVREDGAYVEAGENDNLIVQKLGANPDSLGIFGFSFLDQNHDRVQGSIIGGIAPTFENIAAARYPVSRSLYFYVKNAQADQVPGVREFVAEFTSSKAIGEYGYLADKGLIPMPEDERLKFQEAGAKLLPLVM